MTGDGLFETFVFCTGILILKMFSLGYLIGAARIYYKAAITPEDTNSFIKGMSLEKNDNVERFRRVHLNNLENIPFFIISAFLFILSDPAIVAAKALLWTYTVARISYTISYAFLKSTVLRIISFEVSMLINIYLVAATMWYHTFKDSN